MLTHVPVAALPPERFKDILDAEQAAELDHTVARAGKLLAGRAVWSVSSTARGGGVAEMLSSLIAYSRGAGVDARWVVIEGDEPFFRVTKRLHNMLHGAPGDGGELGRAEESVYRRTAAANARELAELVRPGDLVLLHDPQTGGLVTPLRERGAHVVWRSHVGIDDPGELARAAWDFLLPHLQGAEAFVFSRTGYVWEGLDQSAVVIVPPSIDAFSAKNQELPRDAAGAILAAAGLVDRDGGMDVPEFTRQDGAPGRVDRQAELHGAAPVPKNAPLLLQVSRWDRLKDHAGVMDAFCSRVAPRGDAHLVLAGPSAAAVSDDPEGLDVLHELEARREACPAGLRERVHLASLPMEDIEENAAIVNALQRRADVVAQKSLAEGFGLTVSEAMWKGRPVVASRVGGIRDQITAGESGLLVEPDDLDGFAEAVNRLLDDRAHSERIGAAAREEVRGMFLGPRHLTQYVDLFARLI